MQFAQSPSLDLSEIIGRSVRIASPMGIEPESPRASTRPTRSRSVTSPMILPPSRTATEPTLRSAMSRAASRQGVMESSAITSRVTCLSILAMAASDEANLATAPRQESRGARPECLPECHVCWFPMDLSAHFDRLRVLIEAERAAETQRFAEAAARLSLTERGARGTAAVDLQAADEEGLAGRALVTFVPVPGHDAGGAQIGVGSPVRVVQRRTVPEDAPSGIVARRARGRIAVAFDEPPPDWVTDGRVSLELLASSVTYDRLAAGLRRIAEASRWHAPLKGEPLRFSGTVPGPRLLHGLNAEQTEALELADRARDLMLVHGPPGTGKTTVLVEVVRRAA